MRRCRFARSADRSLGGQDSLILAIAMVDDRRVVRVETRFRQRKRRRTKGTFGGNATDDPVGAPATGAVVHFLVAIDRMITATRGVVPHVEIAQTWNTSHNQTLSDGFNG